MLKDSLVTLILGNEFDGEVHSASRNCRFHIDAIKQLYYFLSNEGKNLGNININEETEACFDLITKGHIVIQTVALKDGVMFFVYIPNEMSINQLKQLKALMPQFKGLDNYICTLNGEFLDMQPTKEIEKDIMKKKTL